MTVQSKLKRSFAGTSDVACSMRSCVVWLLFGIQAAFMLYLYHATSTLDLCRHDNSPQMNAAAAPPPPTLPTEREPLSILVANTKHTMQSQAFFITMPEKAQQNLTSHALHEITKVANSLSIETLHTVYGTYDGRYGDVFQLGLTLAHLTIWETILERNLTSAWIFEDDVVFHEDFSRIFPTYWSKVPHDYELVWLGFDPIFEDAMFGIFLDNSDLACELESHTQVRREFVWGTHAMAVSAKAALRLSNALKGILRMSQHIKRTPHVEETRIDRFLNFVGSSFVLPHELEGWVVLDPTVDTLAAWGGHTWCPVCPFEIVEYEKSWKNCCEKCSPEQVEEMIKYYRSSEDANMSPMIPLRGTGLVYQNLCKRDPWALEKWRASELSRWLNGSTFE